MSKTNMRKTVAKLVAHANKLDDEWSVQLRAAGRIGNEKEAFAAERTVDSLYLDRCRNAFAHAMQAIPEISDDSRAQILLYLSHYNGSSEAAAHPHDEEAALDIIDAMISSVLYKRIRLPRRFGDDPRPPDCDVRSEEAVRRVDEILADCARRIRAVMELEFDKLTAA